MVTRSARVRFFGKVQGVFFRAHTKRKARALGLKGWVKNLPDGSVEALFEGDAERIKEIIIYCRTSIPGAEVKLYSVEWGEPTCQFETFEITY